MVLVNLSTHCLPWKSQHDDDEGYNPKRVIEGERPRTDEKTCPFEIAELISSLYAARPEERLSFAEAMPRLQELCKKIATGGYSRRAGAFSELQSPR